MTVSASFGRAYEGRRVFVTGHTGFKGSWLTVWLEALGAQVYGYALDPPTDPSLFDLAGLADVVAEQRVSDVRDGAALSEAIAETRPEFVFHLAAQPLVRASYDDPRGTYETNVMGTVNVLEAARSAPSVRAVVVVTSDKCYENREWERAYRESDAMGGHDPYSSSKGCAELVCSAYRRSFFGSSDSPGLASARAGNVIGGGDWAVDRIVPDCVRALTAAEEIEVRNPHAIRPWQHVLESLSGYLWLGSRLAEDAKRFAGAWNFGPLEGEEWPVGRLVERFVEEWGTGSWRTPARPEQAAHEAASLRLDSSKATSKLGWRPVWGTAEAVRRAALWYRLCEADPSAALRLVREDVSAYETAAADAGVAWALSGAVSAE